MRTALTAFVSIATFATLSPIATAQQPADWLAYDFNQFITQAGTSPRAILEMDHNGWLALLAANGVNTAELRRVTGATASQVQLLVDWGLLERHQDDVRTAFPILDSTGTTALRDVTARAGAQLSQAIAGDVSALRGHLETIGRAPNTFSIVFSYVLDGLMWDLWEERGTIPERALTLTSPFWAGEVWANRPPRANIVGTNSIADGGVGLNVTWSYAALPNMRPFVNMRALAGLFEGFAAGRMSDAYARELFAPYDLFDAGGQFTIPIIERNSSDVVHAMSLRIAKRLAGQIPDLLDVEQLRQRFGFRSDAQALIVVYHELMWDILAALERAGVLQRPRILVGTGPVTPADVSALVFGLR